MMHDLAMAEMSRYEWESLETMGSRGHAVPAALRGLIFAATEDEAEGYYWKLENVIVVQGQLFEAGPPAVSVLMAALTGNISDASREFVLELLFQLVSGESDLEAAERGNSSLGAECRSRARQGLWTLYHQRSGRLADAAQQILDRIEDDRERLAALTSGSRVD